MTGENAFRIILIVVTVVQTVVSLSYLRTTGAGSTIFQKRDEGLLLTAGISIFYLAYGAGVVAYFVNPESMAWSAVAIPRWLRWAGAIPLLLGAYWSIRGLQFIGNNITISISTKEDHALVTSGPYGWVRHPLYSAGMVETVGVCLLMANLCVTVCASLFWALIAVRTPMEEQKLIERFGDDYREYRQHVGRFVPAWKQHA